MLLLWGMVGDDGPNGKPEGLIEYPDLVTAYVDLYHKQGYEERGFSPSIDYMRRLLSGLHKMIPVPAQVTQTKRMGTLEVHFKPRYDDDLDIQAIREACNRILSIIDNMQDNG